MRLAQFLWERDRWYHRVAARHVPTEWRSPASLSWDQSSAPGGIISQMQTVHTLRDNLVGAEATPRLSAQQRYLALDAYRGFIMLVLVSGGFGLAELAKRRPAFTGIAQQFDHRPWEWIAFWDLIQPAFMFMVGVAMPLA